MKFIHNDPSLKPYRKDLRNQSTQHEKILWKYLKNDKLGVRFRRQFSVGPYIADFLCVEKKLIIELDGSHHYYEKGIEYDTVRDNYLKHLDYTILRFSNSDVMNSLDGVIMKIKGYL
jgi:very-short-patch-repair endonuclease